MSEEDKTFILQNKVSWEEYKEYLHTINEDNHNKYHDLIKTHFSNISLLKWLFSRRPSKPAILLPTIQGFKSWLSTKNRSTLLTL